NWLTTVVDSLVIKDAYKDEAYRGAVAYIAQCLMDFLTDRNIPAMNENAISNILVDVDFLEDQFRGAGRSHLLSVFGELRSVSPLPFPPSQNLMWHMMQTTSIVLSDTVSEYLVPANRQTSYGDVRPKRLQALLEKLAKYGASCRDAPAREKGEKRRKEADAVGRLFPGESR
ncbi:hypothetical protein EWM64_g675, partial [Hericium alpestre]